MATAYLSLGTNLGDKEQNILKAYDMLEDRVGKILRRSTMIETEPWGFESQNTFLNSTICIETTLSPHELLVATQQIERDLGRTMKSTNGEYHDRIIDIDILLYDDLTIDEPDLKIPHPLMKERDFVMIPYNQLTN